MSQKGVNQATGDLLGLRELDRREDCLIARRESSQCTEYRLSQFSVRLADVSFFVVVLVVVWVGGGGGESRLSRGHRRRGCVHQSAAGQVEHSLPHPLSVATLPIVAFMCFCFLRLLAARLSISYICIDLKVETVADTRLLRCFSRSGRRDRSLWDVHCSYCRMKPDLGERCKTPSASNSHLWSLLTRSLP
ncbi:hypothetical protein BD413DRAFT_267204 [Trametes elegans]|nr:hypothetical protein BD413DRAFT_267204 [Trametes elegans]